MSKKVLELRSTGFVGGDDLAIENRVAHIERGGNPVAEAFEAAHRIAVA